MLAVSHNARERKQISGQSLVEFALLVPVMLLLLVTAIDLGRLMYSQITVTNAAKEGAIVASQGGTFQANQACSSTNTIMCAVLTEARGGFVQIDTARVTAGPALCQKDAQYPATGSPPNVNVTVTAPFKILTPFIGAIITPNLTLTGSAQAQCLVVPAVAYSALPTPTAVFAADRTSGTVPPNFVVNFNASASTSPGATIKTYSWSFGGSSPSPTASHTYTAPGTYNVTLTVTDSRGATATSNPTTITVSPPSCGSETVTFTATSSATPGKPHRMDLNGSIAPSAGSWTWAWSGAITATGQTPKNVDFPASGSNSVTLTVTNSVTSCAYSATQTVTAP
jgi:PKD repeat protein